MKKFIKNNFYYLLILFFIIVNFNILEKIYLISLNDYNKRLLIAYGNCEKEGYGFVKKNINDEIIKSNFYIKNESDFPSIKGMFYKFSKDINYQTYIFLINNKNKFVTELNSKNYQIIKNEGNCFLLKKND